MQQIQIPFEQNLDIPKSHFHAFMVCNSAASNWSHKQAFYDLKNEMLDTFGHKAEFDLQIIKQRCHSCNGTGVFKCHWKLRELCWSCNGSGTYRTKKVVLQRFILNNNVFHKPIGEYFTNTVGVFNGWDEWGRAILKNCPFSGTFINKIDGLIKHEPMDANPTFSFYYLLWNYNRAFFYKRISYDINSYSSRTKYKLKRMLVQHNPLKVFADFFKVKKQQIEQFDDLPF